MTCSESKVLFPGNALAPSASMYMVTYHAFIPRLVNF